MRLARFVLGLVVLGGALVRADQNPPPAGQQPPATPAQQPGGRGGGGRGRGGVQVMTLTVPWTDGGSIPVKHTQAGGEVSPALSWTNVPETAASFVLIVHDVDALTGGGDDLLHWMMWRIPGTARELPEGVPQGPQLPDGTRQISGTGPYYRGPAAPATGPAHHFLFELYALDTMIEVLAVGASPAETRAAVIAAMATHVRGKAVAVGLFKRQPATP